MTEAKRMAVGAHTVVVGGTLKMKEFRQMVAAEKSGEIEQMYPWLVRLIMEWTIPGDDGNVLPISAEGMDELTLLDFRAVSSAVGDYIKAELEAKN